MLTRSMFSKLLFDPGCNVRRMMSDYTIGTGKSEDRCYLEDEVARTNEGYILLEPTTSLITTILSPRLRGSATPSPLYHPSSVSLIEVIIYSLGWARCDIAGFLDYRTANRTAEIWAIAIKTIRYRRISIPCPALSSLFFPNLEGSRG